MEDIKSTLHGLKNTISKTSVDFVKQAKMGLSLSGEEEKLRQVYLEIGKKVHEIYAYGGNLGNFFDEKYQEILKCEANIERIKRDLDAVKGAKSYVHSPAPKAPTAPPEPVPAPLPEPVSPPENKHKTCSLCGEKNDMQNRFCLGCGRILN